MYNLLLSLILEQTPFEDGIFHLRLQYTPDYPLTPPNAHFITKIFHPNIAPRTGEVCVNTLKRDWNSKVTLSDILMVLPDTFT
jgi:ubiquitin-protein ligase